MARQLKQGLEYFPLNVTMDDEIELIEAKHDLIGFAVIIKLYQKIYANGYFINVTDDTLLLFSKRINVDILTINAIIKDCLHYGIFDEKMFTEHQILTSKGIQSRYLEAIIRRKNVDIVEDFLLMSTQTYQNVTLIGKNVDMSTQSKVKYSKENNKLKPELGNSVLPSLFPEIVPDEKTVEPKVDLHKEFLNKFNEVRKQKLRILDQKAAGQLDRLIKKGITPEEIITALSNAMAEKYHIETGFKYLTPEFITRQDKFNRYSGTVSKTLLDSDYD